ncbi:MAG: ABC transporter ATP-binding protein [Gammaproteobacteria bacterium]|nr:ABC transporter ATP-binding protein [Gammaproteobacteria bacterium]MDH3450310.1 ABC transporter ATP-binding protein [Gammaproteobacteria bacterium]
MYALEIENLHKTYASGLQALKGIDLKVEEGDFFALLGPNGAGKSTCIGIISGLVNKTRGSVRIFGHSIDDEFTIAKSLLGSVPQEFNFNAFEPVEEIVINQAGYYGVPARSARHETERYLKQLGLWQHRRSQARRLSGGMKRRLMIARALVHQPRLLILDEPTAGVDIELRRTMWDFLDQINDQGTTIILTTHYLEEAERMCRNVAIIDEGNIIQNTSMKKLLNQLNSETFVLYLREELAQAPRLQSFDNVIMLDHLSIEVEVPERLSINDLIRELEAQGIVVERMRNKVNRLEELFVKMTAKSGAASAA